MFGLINEPGEPGFVRKTLLWCNWQRLKRFKLPLRRLPQGRRNDPLSCPCGAATGLYVASRTFCTLDEWSEGINTNDMPKFPPAVEEFVHAFDLGRLPQYILPSS